MKRVFNMQRDIWSWLYILAGLLVLIVLCYFSFFPNLSREGIEQRLEEITVLTRNNANCYYIYREQPMGFEYELAQAFAEYMGLELEVKTKSWNDLLKTVNTQKAEIVAAGMTITPERRQKASFSDPYMDIQQQVILHRRNYGIENIRDLDRKKVHVREGTTYQSRLQEINQSRDINIDIVTHQDIPTQELIRKVGRKQIKFTIADSNIAYLNRRYYPNIKVAFPIQEKQSLGWAVGKGDTELLRHINEFFRKIKETGLYGKIYEKYYANVNIFDYFDLKKFHQRLQTRLPRYQGFIKYYAEKYGFDWKLIAAVVYQESHFNPRARSYTGVRGLMQVTLDTAQEVGISNRLDPEQSIRGGVKYLDKLYSRWDEIQGRDRLYFALASYNIGYGHVRDAQKIAQEKGLDPKKWSSLKKTLPLLRIKKYYKNTKYGYARGTEPVRYIRHIKTYYDILKQKDI